MIRTTMATLALGLCSGLIAHQAHAEQTRPDVIMVVWDTMRADHLQMYGYGRNTAPNLEGIAANAVVFDDAQTSGSWTVPSVSSIFSGMFVHNHGVDYAVKDHSINLPDSIETLAEVMKADGYKTALYTAQSVYYRDSFLQGFDEHKQIGGGAFPPLAFDFLEKAGDQPTFIVLYWLNPHSPYMPPPELNTWGKGGPDVNIIPDEAGWEDRERWYAHNLVNSGKVNLDDTDWQQLRNLYDGEIKQNDHRLGNWWRRSTDAGLLDNTVFVFTADHGENFNDVPQQRTWHGWPSQANQHVPLVIATSNMEGRGQKHVPTSVRTVDIYPTILELAGVKFDHEIDGKSLVPMLRGHTEADRTNIGFSHLWKGLVFYRDATHSLIYSRDDKDVLFLFDRKADPEEKNNLAESDPALAAAVKLRAMNFEKQTTLDVDRSDQAPMTDEETERLRALGYIE